MFERKKQIRKFLKENLSNIVEKFHREFFATVGEVSKVHCYLFLDYDRFDPVMSLDELFEDEIIFKTIQASNQWSFAKGNFLKLSHIKPNEEFGVGEIEEILTFDFLKWDLGEKKSGEILIEIEKFEENEEKIQYIRERYSENKLDIDESYFETLDCAAYFEDMSNLLLDNLFIQIDKIE